MPSPQLRAPLPAQSAALPSSFLRQPCPRPSPMGVAAALPELLQVTNQPSCDLPTCRTPRGVGWSDQPTTRNWLVTAQGAAWVQALHSPNIPFHRDEWRRWSRAKHQTGAAETVISFSCFATRTRPTATESQRPVSRASLFDAAPGRSLLSGGAHHRRLFEQPCEQPCKFSVMQLSGSSLLSCGTPVAAFLRQHACCNLFRGGAQKSSDRFAAGSDASSKNR